MFKHTYIELDYRINYYLFKEKKEDEDEKN